MREKETARELKIKTNKQEKQKKDGKGVRLMGDWGAVALGTRLSIAWLYGIYFHKSSSLQSKSRWENVEIQESQIS